MAKWYRVFNPKTSEILREFELPRKWYVDSQKTQKALRDTELLYQLSFFLKGVKVVFVRSYDSPEEVAAATEHWSAGLVVSGNKYSAKVRKEPNVPVELAVFRV